MRTLLSIVLLFAATTARADEFYCLLFAADSVHPKYCHVWGTCAQMRGDKLVKDVTISWAGEGGWNVLDQKKRGYHETLKESMDFAKHKGICVWGPYEIKEDFFLKFETKYKQPGYYKALDFLDSSTKNCIHYLSDVTGKRLITHVRYGKFAASAISKHYYDAGVTYPTVNDGLVIRALQLNNYKLRRMHSVRGNR